MSVQSSNHHYALTNTANQDAVCSLLTEDGLLQKESVHIDMVKAAIITFSMSWRAIESGTNHGHRVSRRFLTITNDLVLRTRPHGHCDPIRQCAHYMARRPRGSGYEQCSSSSKIFARVG